MVVHVQIQLARQCACSCHKLLKTNKQVGPTILNCFLDCSKLFNENILSLVAVNERDMAICIRRGASAENGWEDVSWGTAVLFAASLSNVKPKCK